uniref:Uncharacterized protein n=1 Tax=Anguilla anguilla TaxID=7936 RepID=A0A0E9RQM8_ANGAN
MQPIVPLLLLLYI